MRRQATEIGTTPIFRPLSPDPRDSVAIPASWSAADAPPPLAPLSVHVWRADLGTAATGLGELLDRAERRRAERIADASRRARFAAARGLLRHLLGHYTGADPRALALVESPGGKPALAGANALEFNVSHSGPLALLAFSATGPVGVDLERIRRVRSPIALARRALGEEVSATVAALPPERRDAEFLRAWARHEAVVKFTGEGLASGSRTHRHAWIQDLPALPDAFGAVALERAPSELVLLERTSN